MGDRPRAAPFLQQRPPLLHPAFFLRLRATARCPLCGEAVRAWREMGGLVFAPSRAVPQVDDVMVDFEPCGCRGRVHGGAAHDVLQGVTDGNNAPLSLYG